MNKRNKVINLFGDKNTVVNDKVKYSNLFNDFLEPFNNDFPKDIDIEDVFEFGMNAWNLGNMSIIIPEKDFQEMLSDSPSQYFEGALLDKMIKRKISHFKEHDRFIADLHVKEVNGKPVVSVTTEEKESFIQNLMDEIEGSDPFNEDFEEDFEEGLINRQAIILKPQQVFIDWVKLSKPDFEDNEIDETKIYLFDEIYDIEDWLRNKFDKLFMTELEEWQYNKKKWPQKRTYKMFNQWFQVQVSTHIFDLEEQPVFKE